MSSNTCQPKTVFESATVDIQFCPDCKMLHLTMGAITLRMSEQHFSSFAQDIARGLFEFQMESNATAGLRMLM